ncbi:glycosyltransferase family 2 protein [Saccharibacillus alkalitolerans]|uniref:Glycosyltransferase family 2 protein n=1 Tax=Saccharibacillus alkalitolerans TaxID=2705290 RepID=A0ABX0F0Q2_9BACL|nr:glycosyltransferase family 2 protein [Saccharibacillus alkalitolerans]NGZ74035.1 glycosyltransferase family 2 protein [Saccharibacillus alkalitolerans]
MNHQTRISVIIPMYNEAEVIAETYRRLTDVMRSTNESYELLFVNDGGVDRSPEIIRDLALRDKSVKLIDFSRNFGHQVAVTAGMDYAEGDAVVIIDADLQDPPELIPDMLDKWREGYDVVYAQRVKRKGETLFKKWSAALFYRVLRASTEVPIPVDTGDFRLIDRKVCDEMNRLGERNPFVRGLVSWTGFRQTAIEYERDERLAGETKYLLKKMIKLCLDGLTSFSHKPLKLAGYAGGIMSAAGFAYMLYAVAMALFTDNTIRGWTSTVCLMLIFNGFTLIMLGVIGEYIGRIYDEVKGRPLYIVRETLNTRRVPARQTNVRDRTHYPTGGGVSVGTVVRPQAGKGRDRN